MTAGRHPRRVPHRLRRHDPGSPLGGGDVRTIRRRGRGERGGRSRAARPPGHVHRAGRRRRVRRRDPASPARRGRPLRGPYDGRQRQHGLMFRERRVLGPAQVVYARRGSAGSRLSPADVDRAASGGAFEDARWLHLTGITPALSEHARAATDRAIDLARNAGATVSLDLNLRRRLWSDEDAAPVLRDLAGRVDVLFGSPDELAVVAGLRHVEDAATLARAAAGSRTGHRRRKARSGRGARARS